jgi:hypothetical protein
MLKPWKTAQILYKGFVDCEADWINPIYNDSHT